MKKATSRQRNGLRREYDLKELQGSVRGKYYRRYTAGTNLVLLDPDVADAFPTAKDMNEALRVLVNVASKRVRRPRRGKQG